MANPPTSQEDSSQDHAGLDVKSESEGALNNPNPQVIPRTVQSKGYLKLYPTQQ